MDTDTKSCLTEFGIANKSHLKVIHVNAQSLTYECHSNEFIHLFDNSMLDIVAVSETFYKNECDIVPLYGFNVFTSNRTSHDGGGVAVYVNSNYKCKILGHSISPNFRIQQPDFLVLEISCHTFKLLFACIYRPPKAGYLDQFEDCFFPLCAEYENVIIAGDVNAHFGSSLPYNISDSKAIMQLLETCNLTRVPYGPTFHSGNCDSALDMICTNSIDKLICFNQLPVSGLSAHDLLAAAFMFCNPKFSPTIVTMRDFSSFDINIFKEDIINSPWDELFKLRNINDKVTYFNATLIALYDKHAPMKSFRAKHRPKPWFSRDLKARIVSRDIAYKRYLRTRSDHDFEIFRSHRNKTKTAIRDAKTTYANDLFSRNGSSKEMWNALRSLNVTSRIASSSCSYPPADDLNKYYTTATFTDAEAIDEAVNYYSSLPTHGGEKFFFDHIYFHDLNKAVSSLKSNAKGVDGISTSMFKNCLVELSPALLHIFNYSLQYGVFPDLWKIASVKPLPKKPNADDVKSFRPISILCVLSKLLEKIVHSQLVKFLNDRNLFHPMQSGFRFGHSTTSALLKVTGDIREAVGNRKLCLLVLYDFSNAFPSVHHELLLSKLKNLGLSLSALTWFKSYLLDRKQFVNTGTCTSSHENILLGVPQGSVLGPLLYSLYVNDISNVFKNSSFHLFADDLQNYVEFYPNEYLDAVDIINNEASRLVDYANCHNLAINSKKTQVIVIGNSKLLSKLPKDLPPIIVNGSSIPYSETVINLGVIVDKHLCWKPYTLTICNKVIGTLQQLRRHKHLLPRSVRKRLVECLIFPIIDYGSVACEGMLVEDVNRLQRLQNACVRYVLDIPRDAHISRFYPTLNWLKITTRRNYYAVCLLKKVLNYHIPPYLSEKLLFVSTIHNRTIRDCKKLRVPQHRTDKHRGAFWIYSIVLWNNLPSSVTSCASVDSFKHHARTHFMSIQ